MPTQINTNLPLLPERAFVVQFREGVDLEHGPVTGRVEHVVSGQATRFASLEELTAFFTRVLTTVQLSASGRHDRR
jgi:hypothetical protein